MSDVSILLNKLIEIGKVDQKLARRKAEKSKIEIEIKKKEDVFVNLKALFDQKNSFCSEKERSYKKQDDYLKSEQEKLTARRKSLSTLGDYKIQQKGEKEIEIAAKQLAALEEELINTLDVIDHAKKEKEAVETKLNSSKAEIDKLKNDSSEHHQRLDQEIQELQKAILESKQGIERRILGTYERITVKYPGEAVMPVENNACTGCFCSLGAQVMVRIARGKELVTCQSCGRMLYLPPDEDELATQV